MKPFEGVEHRLQMRQRQVLVEFFGECFQIDIGRVHELEEGASRLGRNVAGRHRDRFDPLLATCFGRVDCVFGPDDRIVVGVGDARAPQFFRGGGDGLRRRAVRSDDSTSRDLEMSQILAKFAAQVAACRAKGKHTGAGIKMIERFFFDRIDAKTGAAAVRGQHDLFPVPILPDKAESAVAWLEVAFSWTQVADDPPVVIRIVPPAARLGAVGVGPLPRG